MKLQGECNFVETIQQIHRKSNEEENKLKEGTPKVTLIVFSYKQTSF
jgi:hypothetical protein